MTERETPPSSSIAPARPGGASQADTLQAEHSGPPKAGVWRVGTLVYTAGGLVALFCCLLWGDFSIAMKERALQPVAMLMLRGFDAKDWLVGLLCGSIPAGIGMLIAPWISVVSDRHRSRRGRRIPFLLYSTPVVTLGMVGLAASPFLGEQLHFALGNHSPGTMACKIIVFSFFWTAVEMASIVVNTLIVALANDVVPQKIIGRFLSLFRAVSLTAAILFNYYLIGIAKTHFAEILTGLAILFGIGFSIMCFMVKEGDYGPLPEKVESFSFSRFTTPLAAYFRECFTEPFYLWCFFATTLGALSLGPVNAFSIFHAGSLGMSDGYYGKCLALSYAASLALTFPLGWLADRFHPVRLGIGSMALYAAVTLYGYFFASTPDAFAVAFVLHTVVAGIYLTGTASIMQRLFPRSKFAQFASAAALVAAICSMVLPPILGVCIERAHHDYNLVFIIGCCIAVTSLFAYFGVLSRFKKLGGDEAYAPPGQFS